MPASKFLSKERILIAMKRTKTNNAAARHCHVSLITYRKYAKLYKDEKTGKSLYELHKNIGAKGTSKYFGDPGKTEPPLKDILTGKVPHYRFKPERIKQRIIQDGVLEEKCYQCGFSEKRVLDLKLPLILRFKNGDKGDYSVKNIDFLCYNCYFLYVGNVFTDKEITSLEKYDDWYSKDQQPDWELDESMRIHFEEIGLMEPDTYTSGSEFISYR